MNGLAWLGFLAVFWAVVAWLVRRDQRRHDARMRHPSTLAVYCRCGSHRLGRGSEAMHDRGVRHSREECMPTGWHR